MFATQAALPAHDEQREARVVYPMFAGLVVLVAILGLTTINVVVGGVTATTLPIMVFVAATALLAGIVALGQMIRDYLANLSLLPFTFIALLYFSLFVASLIACIKLG